MSHVGTGLTVQSELSLGLLEPHVVGGGRRKALVKHGGHNADRGVDLAARRRLRHAGQRLHARTAGATSLGRQRWVCHDTAPQQLPPACSPPRPRPVPPSPPGGITQLPGRPHLRVHHRAHHQRVQLLVRQAVTLLLVLW